MPHFDFEGEAVLRRVENRLRVELDLPLVAGPRREAERPDEDRQGQLHLEEGEALGDARARALAEGQEGVGVPPLPVLGRVPVRVKAGRLREDVLVRVVDAGDDQDLATLLDGQVAHAGGRVAPTHEHVLRRPEPEALQHHALDQVHALQRVVRQLAGGVLIAGHPPHLGRHPVLQLLVAGQPVESEADRVREGVEAGGEEVEALRRHHLGRELDVVLRVVRVGQLGGARLQHELDEVLAHHLVPLALLHRVLHQVDEEGVHVREDPLEGQERAQPRVDGDERVADQPAERLLEGPLGHGEELVVVVAERVALDAEGDRADHLSADRDVTTTPDAYTKPHGPIINRTLWYDDALTLQAPCRNDAVDQANSRKLWPSPGPKRDKLWQWDRYDYCVWNPRVHIAPRRVQAQQKAFAAHSYDSHQNQNYTIALQATDSDVVPTVMGSDDEVGRVEEKSCFRGIARSLAAKVRDGDGIGLKKRSSSSSRGSVMQIKMQIHDIGIEDPISTFDLFMECETDL
ncbi:hypothetical protein FOCC_FOCC005033 [Frankliniella occidentalis]|nr:hypothetical protein FOCC_FOCC005033 [Frankliniella occidentalis]